MWHAPFPCLVKRYWVDESYFCLLELSVSVTIYVYLSLSTAIFFSFFNYADCPLNQVYGFGSGKRGQLGVSKDKIKSINLPQVISSFEDAEIVQIAANGDHSAALSGEFPTCMTFVIYLFFNSKSDKLGHLVTLV